MKVPVKAFRYRYLENSNILSSLAISVRILAVLGFAVTVSAVIGGIAFGYQCRRSLGQMMNSFVGMCVANLLQLFFMNKPPGFTWSKGDN